LIIIAGGGIAGLSLAWNLAKRGEKITLIERDFIGSGASWAATAYLEPRLGTGAMRALEWAAIKAWPGFIADLEHNAGTPIDHRKNGQMRLAFSENLNIVKSDAETRQAQGWNIEWLEDSQVHTHEPHLSSRVIAAAFLPDVHWVNARLLCKALATAITKSGGTIIERQKITGILHEHGRVSGVTTSHTTINANRVVLATAMGTNSINGLPPEFPECRAVKGTILSLGMDKNSPIITHLLRHPNGHVLAPRSDGRLLVGSTHEDDETSPDVSMENRQQLKQSAIDLLPEAANLPVIEATSGIRALIGDGALRLGTTTTYKGLYYSLSHAGAGFLRAPTIAEQFADFILDPEAPCQWIDRFLHRG